MCVKIVFEQAQRFLSWSTLATDFFLPLLPPPPAEGLIGELFFPAADDDRRPKGK